MWNHKRTRDSDTFVIYLTIWAINSNLKRFLVKAFVSSISNCFEYVNPRLLLSHFDTHICLYYVNYIYLNSL